MAELSVRASDVIQYVRGKQLSASRFPASYHEKDYVPTLRKHLLEKLLQAKRIRLCLFCLSAVV